MKLNLSWKKSKVILGCGLNESFFGWWKLVYLLLPQRNLKTHQMFSSPEKFENATAPFTLDLDYRDAIAFKKLRFQNVFRPHEIEKPAFSNSSGLKSVL